MIRLLIGILILLVVLLSLPAPPAAAQSAEDSAAAGEDLTFWQEFANVATFPFRMIGAAIYYPLRLLFYDVWVALWSLVAGSEDPAVPALREGTLAERVEAARSLLDPGSARALVPLLSDPDPELRAAAAESLGRLGARDLGGELLALLEGAPPETAAAAAEALGRVGAVESLPRLLALVRAGFPPERAGAAAVALGHLREADGVWALAAALRHDSPLVRRQAAWALGEIGRAEAAPFLAPLLSDADPAARASAAAAMGKIPAGRDLSVPLLRRLLEEVPAPRTGGEALVAMAAATSLGRLRSADAAPALRALLAAPRAGAPWEAPLRSAAALALARSGADARDAILPPLADPDARVSRTAGVALGIAGAVEELGRALGDESAAVRESAAIGLGRATTAGGDEAGRLLRERAATDADSVVRYATAKALLARRDRAGLSVLVREVTRGGLESREAAIRELARLSGEDHGVDGAAWERWLREKGGALDLARFAPAEAP